MEEYRKICMKQQAELRKALEDTRRFDDGIRLFFRQHAMLHSGRVAKADWSYEDALLDDLEDVHLRCILPREQHSIAWLIWHIARCEDITMNLLVAGSAQVFHRDSWLASIHVKISDTGNAMNIQERKDFSAAVDLEALRNYRVAVGLRTREIVAGLSPIDLGRRVSQEQLNVVRKEGAVVEAANEIVEYWGRRTIAGLLLVPATRHNLVHLNEGLGIKRKLR